MPAHNSLDNSIMAISFKLFEIALNCKFHENKVEFSPDRININCLSLLFAWPGILMIGLSSLNGHKENQNLFATINELLINEKNPQVIFDTLQELIFFPKSDPLFEKLIESKKKLSEQEKKEAIKEELQSSFPKFIKTFILIFHPKSMHFNQSEILRDLIFTLGNFFVIACMMWKILDCKEESAYLTQDDINTILNRSKAAGDFNIFSFSTLFFGFMVSISEDVLNELVKSNDPVIYKNSIPLPHNSFYLHQFVGNVPYCTINSSPDCVQIDFNDENTIGLAYDINLFKNLDYHLWHIGTIHERISEYNDLEGAFLFSEENNTKNSILENLFNRLYQMAKQSSLIASSMHTSWHNLIENFGTIVESDFKKFDEWMASLMADYKIKDELFSYRSLLNGILSLGIYINDEEIGEEIEKKRREVFTAHRKHISPDLEKTLREANYELEDIFSKFTIPAKQNIPKDFTKRVGEYILKKEFEHIIHDDKIFFNPTSEGPKRRESRGLILQRVAKRNGKDTSASMILKRLGYSR